MPKFYVHQVQGETRILDEEGSVYPSLAAARMDTKRQGLDMLIDLLKDGGDAAASWALELWDEQGNHLDTLKLSDLSTN